VVNRAELAALLAVAVNGTVNGSAFAPVVSVHVGEFEVRANDEFNATRAAEHPDGFLYSRDVIEFFAAPGADLEARAAIVGRALESIWSNGWHAVAACDYEDHLPRRGGYKHVPVQAPQTV
jgi:hypothetical protein